MRIIARKIKRILDHFLGSLILNLKKKGEKVKHSEAATNVHFLDLYVMSNKQLMILVDSMAEENKYISFTNEVSFIWKFEKVIDIFFTNHTNSSAYKCQYLKAAKVEKLSRKKAADRSIILYILNVNFSPVDGVNFNLLLRIRNTTV